MNRAIISKIKIKVKDRDLVEDSLKNKPTLIISNHPSQAEVLILLGLLEKREDAYLIADHSFLKLLPSLDKHIIPVYINHRLTGKQKDNWKFWLLTKFHKSECFSKEVAHQKNIESIDLATQKINQGGLVIIFPAVGENKGKFLCGVGNIIKDLTSPAKVNLVMVHVEGTSTLDYLRLIPGFNRILPTIKFNFAKPVSLTKFKGTDAKVITQNLEDFYYLWLRKSPQN
jgi:hypothetical protein